MRMGRIWLKSGPAPKSRALVPRSFRALWGVVRNTNARKNINNNKQLQKRKLGIQQAASHLSLLGGTVLNVEKATQDDTLLWGVNDAINRRCISEM